MQKFGKIILFGLLLWIVPFLASFPFVDASGRFLIPETFFKSVMVVVGAFVGVVLAVRFFQSILKDHLREGVVIGIVWLAISLALDLVLVRAGFFPMSVYQYFTDIGLRYMSIPIYTIGLGYALEQKKGAS